MPSHDPAATLPSPTRMLTVALVATLVAAVAVSSAGAWAIGDSLDDAAEIARREERTAYLVSAVARDTARIRASLLESTDGPPTARPLGLDHARALMEQTRSAERSLPALLGDEERAVWREVEPRLDRMLRGYDRAIAALEQARPSTADRLLENDAEDARQLDAEIDRFQRESVHETEVAVANVHDRTARTLQIVSLVKAALLAAMVLAWILVLRLVASQRRALAVQIARLESSNRDLEAFAGRVAHDMRNVIAPIELGTQVIAQSEGDARVREIAARIDRSCARGRELVDGLLAFSRAAEPNEADRGASANVRRELEDVLDQLDPSIRAANVQVQARIHPDADAALPRALLHAVLLNLLDNAVKFMRDRPRRDLDVEVRASLETVTISITDTGPGIPEHERSRVFDALYRGRSTKGDGAGLGLATVKRIVESHGGRIDIEAAGAGGTTFIVKLPRASPTRDEQAQTSTTTPAPAE